MPVGSWGARRRSLRASGRWYPGQGCEPANRPRALGPRSGPGAFARRSPFRAYARGDVLGDIRRRPSAAEQRAAPGLPHTVQTDEVDAGHRGHALALVGRAVRREHAGYAEPREVL